MVNMSEPNPTAKKEIYEVLVPGDYMFNAIEFLKESMLAKSVELGVGSESFSVATKMVFISGDKVRLYVYSTFQCNDVLEACKSHVLELQKKMYKVDVPKDYMFNAIDFLQERLLAKTIELEIDPESFNVSKRVQYLRNGNVNLYVDSTFQCEDVLEACKLHFLELSQTQSKVEDMEIE